MDDDREVASASRFLLLTDMGLIVKKGAAGGRDVFVCSLSGGTPVSGAVVRIVGRQRSARGRGRHRRRGPRRAAFRVRSGAGAPPHCDHGLEKGRGRRGHGLAAPGRREPRGGFVPLFHAGADQRGRRRERLRVQSARHVPSRRDAAFRRAGETGRLEGASRRHAAFCRACGSFGTHHVPAAVQGGGRRHGRGELAGAGESAASGRYRLDVRTPDARGYGRGARFGGGAAGGISARFHGAFACSSACARPGLAGGVERERRGDAPQSFRHACGGPAGARAALGVAHGAVLPRI